MPRKLSGGAVPGYLEREGTSPREPKERSQSAGYPKQTLLETLCHAFPKQDKQGIWKTIPNRSNSQHSTFPPKFQCWGENSIFPVWNPHTGAADTAKNKGITSSTFLFGILLVPRPQLQLQKIMVWMGFFNSLTVFIPKGAAAGGIFPGN